MAYQKSDYKEDVDRPVAVFETNKGSFEAELYAKECPETVWNFINLAEGRQDTPRGGNYYDGLSFHRVIEGFVIQGGCPFGNGTAKTRMLRAYVSSASILASPRLIWTIPPNLSSPPSCFCPRSVTTCPTAV